jgi:carbamoyltransferase
VGAVLEERFSRVKHDRDWPARAIAWCIQQGGVSLNELSHVAFFWNPALQLDYPHPGRSRSYRHHGDYLHMVPSWLLGALNGPLGGISGDCTTQSFQLDGRGRPLQVHYVTHHRTHAAAAFLPSPFDAAAALTVDGYGEREATTLGDWSRDRDGRWSYRLLERVEYPQSLGAFYAAVTGWLGFRTNSGEGKVMGLAPYGDDSLLPRFREILGLPKGGPAGGRAGGGGTPADTPPYHLDLDLFEFHLDNPRRVSARFEKEFGQAARPGESHSDSQRAVAFAAQAALEEALLLLAARLQRLSGRDALVLAGGVAMNSCANGRIERESAFRRVFVQPAAGDGGAAVGAALWVEHVMLGGRQRQTWVNDRFGPAFDGEACRAALRRGGWTWTEPADVAADTASALARGELVGWFQGGAELGSRSLGGRCILADPRRAANKDVLNARVKFREPFRPFAPSVLLEAAPDWFELPEGASVPFMQKVHPVRAGRRADLGGVTHVDGSARLQTVARDSDPLYYRLIESFGAETGVPAVLNTSFNVRGEPMVLGPDDAIRCWASTGLERLVLGPCVLRKPDGA